MNVDFDFTHFKYVDIKYSKLLKKRQSGALIMNVNFFLRILKFFIFKMRQKSSLLNT